MEESCITNSNTYIKADQISCIKVLFKVTMRPRIVWGGGADDRSVYIEAVTISIILLLCIKSLKTFPQKTAFITILYNVIN